MEAILDITLQHRRNLHTLLTTTAKEKLIAQPKGFTNNLWWNIAHTMVTQQLLVYKLSNLQMRVPIELIEKYKKGTFPGGKPTDEEIMVVADFLISTIEWTKEDFKAALFQNYNTYTTSAKVTLNNVEEAIAFNLFHEGIHWDAIQKLQKAIG